MDRRHLHFKPTYECPLIDQRYYYDIADSDLNIWDLNTFKLIGSYPNITQGLSIKLRTLQNQKLLIADNDKIKIFDLKKQKLTQVYDVEQLIQQIETQPKSGIIVCSSTHSFTQKKIFKWILGEDDKLISKGSCVVKFEEEIQAEDIFLLNVFKSGRIYFYKKLSEQICEIKIQENQVKPNKITKNTTAILQLSNNKNVAVASEGKININDPIKGAIYGYIECEDQIYNTIIQLQEKDMLITSSNKGIKAWMLQSKTQPKFFAKSHSLGIEKLVISDNKLIGIASKTKSIAIWSLDTYQLIKLEKILKQQLQKIVKLNQTLICLVIKIFDQTEESLTFHHKLQIVDTLTDTVVAYKEIKKTTFQIEVNSLISIDQQTIRFICFSDATQKPKAYLFTWRPFTKEQKKQITKIEMSKSAITRLYKFERLICANPPKINKTEGQFRLFKVESKTSIILYNHALKKISEISIDGNFDRVELSQQNKIYAFNKEKIAVFKINSNTSVSLQNQVELSLNSIHFFNNYVIVKNNDGDTILYDHNFELILKTEEESEDPIMKIVKVNECSFIILYKNDILELWDIKKESIVKKKLDFQILDLEILQQTRLFILLTNKIQIFDLYTILNK